MSSLIGPHYADSSTIINPEADQKDLDLVVFDWSGTISDDRFTSYLTNMKLINSYGSDELMSFWEWLDNTKANAVEYLDSKGLEIGDPEEVGERFKQYYRSVCDRGNEPEVYEDASQVLEELSSEGKSLAILSAHPTPNLEDEIEEYGLDGLFNCVVGSCNNKEAELSFIPYYLGVDSEDCLYVGDTTSDIESAREAGLLTAAVTTGYDDKQELADENPDFLAESLTDLKQQLQDYERKESVR